MREGVEERERSIGMGVIVEDEEKPKEEEREHMGCGKRVLYRCNIALESINGGGLLREPRWTIPEMRCKV